MSDADPLYLVPITSYSDWNFAISTSPPSQNKKPYGAVGPAYGRIAPIGIPKSPTNVSLDCFSRPELPPVSKEAR